jgi:hypothetical protein
MNRSVILLFVTAAVVSLGGCTGRIIIGPNPSPSTLVRANQALAAGEAEGVVEDGAIFRSRGGRLSADSVFLGSGVIDGLRVLPRTRVVHITTGKRRGRGMLHGALFGAGGGAILGAVGGCTNAEFVCQRRADAAGFLAVGGALWGVIIGAIIGSRTELIFIR